MIIQYFMGAALCLSAPVISLAQQQFAASTPMQTQIAQPAARYSYHVFLAPNKSFGYHVLRDEKIVFHQPAFSKSLIYQEEMITKEAQANTAATLAIEKIKKGVNPELSSAELRKITGH